MFDGPIIQNLRTKPNVFLLKNRVTVKWGGFSHLETIISLVKEGLNHQDISYFHLLSDSCLPIKPLGIFFNYFEKNAGKEFIEYVKLPTINWAGGGLPRLKYYHLHDLINIKNKFNRKIEKVFVFLQKITGIKRNIHPELQPYYGGSTYWSLSRDFLNYSFKYTNDNPDFIKIFRHTFCAEEIFFQTLLLNSTFKPNAVNDNLRYVDWERRNGNRPANLDDTDFNVLSKSDKLIGRKFIYPLSKDLLERLKKKVLTRNP